MRFRSTLVLVLLACPGLAHAQPAAVSIDWGGGYLRGPDPALTTVATSGAGTPAPAVAPAAAPPSPVAVPPTDWGGGYLRGPDPALTTVATSGAGTPKPGN